jgi:virginiamycin B lyase
LLVLGGCSFDASRLRGTAATDATPPADLLVAAELPPAPEASVVDTPVGPADVTLAEDVLRHDSVTLDSPPSVGNDVHPAETATPPPSDTAPEIDAAVDVVSITDSRQADVPQADAPQADTPQTDLPGGAADAIISSDAASFDGPADVPYATDTLSSAGDAGTDVAKDVRGTNDTRADVADAGADRNPPYTIVEYSLPTPTCQPWALTVGPNGTLWILARATGKLVRFTIADHSFKEFDAVTAASQLEGIARGSDDNLWFTEYGTDKIGRMTPDGTLKEYATTPYTGPDGIVAGPDGNLWFTLMTSNRIGRITTAGVISTYDIPTPSSSPARIAVGSDGSLWFSEYGANRIGYLTPTTPTPGPIGSYGITTPLTYPSGIAGDLDGHLWFYEGGGNRIGRMTTSGSVDEFIVPTANGTNTRASITLGPDNNMWFTEFVASQIGRITPSGSIAEYPTPTKNSAPYGIVQGPDGLVWFTETNSGKLASIAP